MFREFRDFIARGNVIDLAVAVILGAAFNAIVTSLVEDIITPLLGIILGGIDFSGLAVTVGSAQLTYGNFIQAIINFLITAWAIFMMVKAINSVYKKKEASPTPPTDEAVLLAEIRDLLKRQGETRR